MYLASHYVSIWEWTGGKGKNKERVGGERRRGRGREGKEVVKYVVCCCCCCCCCSSFFFLPREALHYNPSGSKVFCQQCYSYFSLIIMNRVWDGFQAVCSVVITALKSDTYGRRYINPFSISLVNRIWGGFHNRLVCVSAQGRVRQHTAHTHTHPKYWISCKVHLLFLLREESRKGNVPERPWFIYIFIFCIIIFYAAPHCHSFTQAMT